MLLQVIRAGEPTRALAFAARPWAVGAGFEMGGLHVAVQVGAAAKSADALGMGTDVAGFAAPGREGVREREWRREKGRGVFLRVAV